MKKTLSVCIVLLALASLGLRSQGDLARDQSSQQLPDEWSAGFAAVDISPSATELASDGVHLGGYFPERIARVLHDAIYARAVALQDGKGEAFALVILDATGVSNRMIKEIQERVHAQSGLDVHRVHVGATHTHAGPDFQGMWGGVSATYREAVIQGASDAIVRAHLSLKPARLFASSMTVNANHNRRDWEFTDSSLTVLEARDFVSDQVIGVLVNYAAHPIIVKQLNKVISSDFCGPTLQAIEAAFPGAVSVFVNGIVGDVTPAYEQSVRPDAGTTDFERADLYGKALAQAVLETRKSAVAVEPAELESTDKNFSHPVTNNGFELAHRLGKLDYTLESSWGRFAIRLVPGYFRLGRTVQGVIFPGEALTRVGLPIKEAMTAPYKLFLGLTDNTVGYFIADDEWRTGRNGNYEEGVSIDRKAGEKTKSALIDLIRADIARD